MAAAFVLAAASLAHGATLQQVSNWTGGVPNLPSDVQMYIYVPDKVVTNPPVLTLIHSCDSNASVVLGQAGGLKSAADQYGFIIVVPQSNPTSLRCWTTDSTQVWTRNAGGDSNAIKQMVVYALSKYQANADRVYVTGCSSGAMMTELLLALYPDIFKAGSSFAGMPAGCHGPSDNTSNATGYNGTCAGGPVTSYSAQQWGDLVRNMDPGYTGHRPRLQLFHGSADSIISYSNMAESEEQYINLLGLSTNPTKTNTGLTLGTHQGTEQQWNNSCGYLVLDGFESIGGDHGPSDALFLPQYVVPFLGLDKTGPVDPEIAQCGSGGAGGSGGKSGGAGSGGAGSGGQGGSSHPGTGGVAGAPGGGGHGGAAGKSGTGGTGGTGAGGTGTGGTGAGGTGAGGTGTGGTGAGGTGAGGTGTGGMGTGGMGTGGASATGGSPGTGGGASGGASAEAGSGGAATGGAGGSQSPGGGSDGSGCSCDVGAAGFDNLLGLALLLGLCQLLLRLRHGRSAAPSANRRSRS